MYCQLYLLIKNADTKGTVLKYPGRNNLTGLDAVHMVLKYNYTQCWNKKVCWYNFPNLDGIDGSCDFGNGLKFLSYLDIHSFIF